MGDGGWIYAAQKVSEKCILKLGPGFTICLQGCFSSAFLRNRLRSIEITLSWCEALKFIRFWYCSLHQLDYPILLMALPSTLDMHITHELVTSLFKFYKTASKFGREMVLTSSFYHYQVLSFVRARFRASSTTYEANAQKTALQKGVLVEFKKDSGRIVLGVTQNREGKRNWSVIDQVVFDIHCTSTFCFGHTNKIMVIPSTLFKLLAVIKWLVFNTRLGWK